MNGSFCNLCAGVTYLRYTVLTSPNKGETAVHCCHPALSVLVMLVSRNVFHVVSALQSIVINFTRIFRDFTKLPESRSDESNLKDLKIQVKFIYNFPRALAITCLSVQSLAWRNRFAGCLYLDGL